MNINYDNEKSTFPYLYQDAVRNSEHLRLINEVSYSITSVLDLDELLRAVVTSIQRAFGYYYVGLSLVENNRLVIKASAGRVAPVIHPDEISLPIGYGSCIGVCVSENCPLLVPDVRFDPNYRWFKELTESKSLIAVPLRFKGNVIGVLSVESDQVAAFDEADLRLLESLGNHVSVSVENAHAYEKAHRRATEVSALLEMAQDLNSHLELTQLLRRLTERALSITRADTGLVFRFDGTNLSSDEFCQSGRWYPIEWFFRGFNHILDNDLKNNNYLIVGAQEIITYPSSWSNPHASSALLVPIRDRSGSPLFLIYLMAIGSEVVFLPGDISLVTTLANQAAIALENARLYALEKEKVEALRELERMKSNFLNSVSHDLRTPLTALKTCSEALLQISSGDEMSKHRQLIHNINRNVDRMAGLVSDILEMAALQSGNMRLQFEMLNLNDIMKDMAEAIRPLTEKTNQTLTLYTSSTKLLVMGDRRRIEQAVMNLLSNAQRFTPPHGNIEIRVLEQANSVFISISNDGPAIPKEDQGRIFEQFYRLAQGGKDRTRGMGLGLSIARSLIELHHGQIWVESPITPEGSGVTFTVSLPKEANIGISYH